MTTESNSESESSPTSSIGPILDLLASAGYGDAYNNDLSDFDKLIHGLASCISSVNFSAPQNIDTFEDIEDTLKLMGCPHALQVTQIKDRCYAGIYPAVQWIVSLVKTQQCGRSYEKEREASVLTEMQLLEERIEEAGVSSMVQKLVSLLKKSKGLERQGTEFQSDCSLKHFRLQSEITRLVEDLTDGNGDSDPHHYLDSLIFDSSKKLKCAKKELSRFLSRLLSLKRQLDELPIEAELVQYERRFSELNVHIQDRLRQTRGHYETYNALLEIKDLMLKEISLLNSVDLQFGDAIGNPAGRTKLIDSMEAIVKGVQQKLEKVQLGVQVDKKTLDTLREQYSTAILNQRHCSVLLKDFQNAEKMRGLRRNLHFMKNKGAKLLPNCGVYLVVLKLVSCYSSEARSSGYLLLSEFI
ncbi:uncharacterized protein LOC104887723 isoform X2 [Beta vulgaris subsp. vulgaris]|uniref:uncharacterized protein LOC104887723 isoform X2 n=1 Tax=Beta vulgaris subsp. vulgaris TaxID=3555 RepID=UPI0020374858|nr:uncharacterized protein LOC104887723 isoform X2 [Beta vulgaris subsp. vulgaris]